MSIELATRAPAHAAPAPEPEGELAIRKRIAYLTRAESAIWHAASRLVSAQASSEEVDSAIHRADELRRQRIKLQEALLVLIRPVRSFVPQAGRTFGA